MAQDVTSSPVIKISDYKLEVVHDFVYLCSTIADSLLTSEIDRHIGKVAITISRLKKRVWSNRMLTKYTKIQVYNACVVTTLLYGSESWACQTGKQAKHFPHACLHCILNITWQDNVPNNTVLVNYQHIHPAQTDAHAGSEMWSVWKTSESPKIYYTEN